MLTPNVIIGLETRFLMENGAVKRTLANNQTGRCRCERCRCRECRAWGQRGWCRDGLDKGQCAAFIVIPKGQHAIRNYKAAGRLQRCQVGHLLLRNGLIRTGHQRADNFAEYKASIGDGIGATIAVTASGATNLAASMKLQSDGTVGNHRGFGAG